MISTNDRDSSRIEAQAITMMAEESNVNWAAEKDRKKYRKLQLLVFKGEDPLVWIFRVERYFTVNEISEAEILKSTTVCLEGKVFN